MFIPVLVLPGSRIPARLPIRRCCGYVASIGPDHRGTHGRTAFPIVFPPALVDMGGHAPAVGADRDPDSHRAGRYRNSPVDLFARRQRVDGGRPARTPALRGFQSPVRFRRDHPGGGQRRRHVHSGGIRPAAVTVGCLRSDPGGQPGDQSAPDQSWRGSRRAMVGRTLCPVDRPGIDF